jgi:hypothetical protein|tara:strand:+ start:170 stop:568 length:399 start_codon:yes stop_codon:yes gene_type:complete
MKYYCSKCSLFLSKDDLKFSRGFFNNKIYCFDCLKKKAGKILKKNTSDEKYKACRKAYYKTLENELVAIAKELRKKEVDKTSHIKSFIIVEPGLVVTLKKNQLLTEAELVRYQNDFGKVSFIAKELKKTEKK